MRRIYRIFSIVIFLAVPGFAQTPPQKCAPAQPGIVEIPNTIEWLPRKRLFCDTSHQFIIATLHRPDAERVVTHALTWNEKIARYFKISRRQKPPILIVVMENESEMKRLSKQKRFQGMSISLPTATEDARIIILTNNKEGLRSILPHELAHLYVIEIAESHQRKKDHKHPASLCINEGIAELFTSEVERQNIRTFCYQAALKNKLYALDTILSIHTYATDMRELALFYCESYSLIDYILHQPDGKKKLIRYLQQFEYTSDNPYELFKEIFCGKISSETFQKRWVKYIYEQYRPPPQQTATKPKRKKSSRR